MNTKSDREPRWKQLGFARSNSHDRSHISKKSSRYTPKKQAVSSQKQFSLFHLQGNSLQDSDVPGLKGSHTFDRNVPEERSLAHYSRKLEVGSQSGNNSSPKFLRYDSGGGSSLQGVSAIYPKGPDVIKPAEARKITQKHRQNSGNSGGSQGASSTSFPFKCNPALSNQQNFKECLKYFDKTQQQLINQKTQVEKIMQQRQQQLSKAKQKLLQAFENKYYEIEDVNLRKVLDKFMDSKFKSPPKQLFRMTSTGDISYKVRYNRQSAIKKSPQTRPKRSFECSVYKENISKIMEAMNAMKRGIEECKEIKNQGLEYAL